MKLKGKVLAVVAMAIVTFTSCDEMLDLGIPLSSGVYEMEFAIPPAKAGSMAIVEELLSTDLDEILSENGQAGSLISEVKVSLASITVLEKSKVKNLDAMESAEVSLSLDEIIKEIASATNTEEGATTLPLDVQDIDVSSILDAEEYKIALQASLKEDLTDTLWVVGKIKYEIMLGLNMNN